MRIHVALLVLVVALTPLGAAAQWRTSVLPVLGSAPETGGQFGVAVFRTRQPDDSLGTRPSSLIGNAVVTSKGQQRAFIEYDRWTAGNDRRLQLLAIASKFPLPYHGFGDNTPDIAMQFEPTTLELSVTRSRKRGEDLWRYLGARFVGTKGEFAYLGNDVISCDSLGCSWPIACDCGPTEQSDYTLGLLTYGRIKDTRDNLFAPTKGRVLDVAISLGLLWTPGYVNILNPLPRLRLDWRGYRPLKNGGVLGAQVFGIASEGGFPLDQVALVGHHSINRGYTMGRFRAESMLSSQVEWRSPTSAMNNRLGVAVFGGVAFLSGTATEGRPLPSGGAGFRYRLDPRTRSTIRVDFAVGASGQKGLYVAFNEAF